MLEVVEILGADRTAQLILAIRNFNRAAPGFLKGTSDRANDLIQRQPAGGEQRGKQLHLVLLFQAANRAHFRDSRHRLQGWLDPILVKKSKFPQVVKLLAVDERVLIDPAHAAGIRTERN